MRYPRAHSSVSGLGLSVIEATLFEDLLSINHVMHHDDLKANAAKLDSVSNPQSVRSFIWAPVQLVSKFNDKPDFL